MNIPIKGETGNQGFSSGKEKKKPQRLKFVLIMYFYAQYGMDQQ